MSNVVRLEFVGDGDKLIRETKAVNNAVDDTGKKTSKMGDSIKGATSMAAGAFAAFGAVALVQLANTAKNLDAMDVKAKTVFQEQLPMMQNWAEENRKAFGASSREVVQMGANLADLLKPMGFTSDQAANMSKEILDLSGALARWTGGTRTAAEVSDILADAMLGETDGLKGLGIAISAADVEARLAAKGQKELEGAALAQAEAVAVQELIMEKSTDAQKAWADGGKAAAEAQNSATSNLAETTERLAQAIQPAYEWLVKFLADAVVWIEQNKELAIALGATAVAIWAVNIAMNANPIVLLITFIGLLVGAIIWLWENSEGFRNFWINIWEGIVSTTDWAVNFVKDIFNGLVWFFTETSIGKLIAEGFKMARDAIITVIDAIKWLIDRIKDAIGWAKSLFDGVMKAVGAGNRMAGGSFTGNLAGNLKRNHTGGVVDGMLGSEQLRILQSGERIVPRGQSGHSGEGSLRIDGDTDSAFATFLMKLVRDKVVRLVVDS